MDESTSLEGKRRIRIIPSCTVREESGKVRIMLEMPGVRKENLEIKIEKNELAVRGKTDEEDPKGSYLVRERPRGDFEKYFTLDDTIDTENVSAELKNGVLDLTLALKEAAKPRRIEIQS